MKISSIQGRAHNPAKYKLKSDIKRNHDTVSVPVVKVVSVGALVRHARDERAHLCFSELPSFFLSVESTVWKAKEK